MKLVVNSVNLSSRKEYTKWLFCFVFINAFVVLAVLLRYFKYMELTGGALAQIYFVISLISHTLFLAFLPGIVLMPFVLLKLPSKLWKILIIVIMSIGNLLLLIDSVVFDLYRFHINAFVIDLLFGGAASQIFNIPLSQYVLAGTFVVGLLFVGVLNSFICNYLISKRTRLFFRIGVPVSLVLLTASHLIHAWAGASYYQPITKISRFYPLYFPLRADDFFYEHKLVDAKNIENNRVKFLNGKISDLKYPLAPLQFDVWQKHPNIMFIVLDSWHYKAMDSVVTPNMYNLALQSQWFTNHRSGSNGTRGGIFTLFYGIPALFWDDMLSTETGAVFISSLQRLNYDMAIYASSLLSSPPFSRTVFRQIKDLRIGSEGNTSCERDMDLTNDFIAYIDSIKQKPDHKPFFSFLFYDAPHAIEHPKNFKAKFQPEWPDPEYLRLSNNTDPTPFYNLYKNSVNYDDSLIGNVLKKLEVEHLKENTIIVITGDHGQEFNDNHKNYWGHNGNYSRAQTGVPMMIYIPEMPPQKYNHLTLHYDVVPTIMKLALGCKNAPGDYSYGQPIFEVSKDRAFVTGSRENFAIVETDKITTVFPNGSFAITDGYMNELDNSKVNTHKLYELLLKVNRFYKTKLTL